MSPKADIDLLILRENSEGLYSGREHWQEEGVGIAERVISRTASQRLAECATQVAAQRRARRITLVHKANVLPMTCGLFRDTCRAHLAAQGWIDVVDERLVDVAALQLVAQPEAFDLIVTSNLFGDILSDLGPACTGTIGIAPAGNINPERAFPSLFEPVHGSAPDIAGLGVANPVGQIWSAALMLDHLGEPEAAAAVLAAIEAVLAQPELRTRDLGGPLGTEACGRAIAEAVARPAG